MPTKLRPLAETPRPIDAGARIGHVHLKVADLDRALGFYTGVLGFELMQRYGQQAAFVSAGGYHHHIGLNTWESLGGSPAPSRLHRPVPRRPSLPHPRRSGRRASTRPGRRHPPRGRQRPRGQRSHLPPRS